MTATAVVIPTYDERENLPSVVARTLAATAGDVHVLVVDDDSPDGTGALADELAAGEPRVHVLHRTKKEGLGPAYLAGFAWARTAGYDVVVEMDADGSHPAETLPAMLDALGGIPRPGLVIGSRWMAGGSVVNWPWTRPTRGCEVGTCDLQFWRAPRQKPNRGPLAARLRAWRVRSRGNPDEPGAASS